MKVSNKQIKLWILSVVLVIPIYSQVFLPPYVTNNNPTVPDTTDPSLNDPVGKPYGGGIGYFPIYESAECDIVINDNDFSNLKNIVESTNYGDIIYINDGLSIEVPSYQTINVPDGVTIASGRGLNGSKGALIYLNNLLDDNYYDYPVFTVGDNVKISGLRIKGPDGTSSSTNYGKEACAIKQEYGENLEVDNCEIYNWYAIAVYLIESDNANIHHNYIHNNQNPHIGYGVCNRNKTDTYIAYNIFNRNRHDIAGVKNTNMTPPSYTAQYNLVGPNGINHSFDVHGCGYTDAWGCPDMYSKDDSAPENVAGTTINIYTNYFIPMTSYPRYHSVVIRGIPNDMANIIGNYFPDDFMDLPDYPVRQTLMWGGTVDGQCKPIDTSFEWNLATGGGGRDPLSSGDCVYNGILQIEPNHINYIDNNVGTPIYIREITWSIGNFSPNTNIVGPEVIFSPSQINNFQYSDLNNDGRTDIVYNGLVSWSGLTDWENITDGYTIDSNHLIDFNGDGNEDSFSITSDSTIW